MAECLMPTHQSRAAHVSIRAGLTVRRELAAEGWVLRFTGPEATGMLMETVLDEVERMVKPG